MRVSANVSEANMFNAKQNGPASSATTNKESKAP